MQIVYMGCEVPSNRTLLETTSANHLGVSFYGLVKRGLPKTKEYLLENYFPKDSYIYLYPGLPLNAKLSRVELEEFSAAYEHFVAMNVDRLTLFAEINYGFTDAAFVEEQRRTVWAQVPPGKFLPMWNPDLGIDNLNQMITKYLDIGIPGQAIESDSRLASTTTTATKRYGTRFHALGCAKPDNLRSIKAETAHTLSWLSPMVHGETIVWDGTRLMRYPKRMKEQARTRYNHVYNKAGLDADLIAEDDSKEVCKLAVWSYEQFEMRINKMGDSYHDNSDYNEDGLNSEIAPLDADNKGVEMRKLLPRSPEEMGNLPVFGYDMKTEVDADGVIQDAVHINSQSSTLRQCNTCFVASNCPAFKPDSVCAFKLPVEVKTKDQLKSLINAIIEMQGQRVAFMRFAEEMNGGYADPNVSQEIDRLFKLIKTTKELDDSREFIRMTVERQGSSGVLSSIFGDKANVLKELPEGGLNEVQTTKIIKDAIEES
jgi:hypothetical protein